MVTVQRAARERREISEGSVDTVTIAEDGTSTTAPDGELTAPPVEADTSRKPKRDKAARLEAKLAKLREAQAAEAAGAAPRSGKVTAALVTLAALVVVLAVAVGVGLPWVLHQRALNDARSDALRAAQRYAVDFGSYDYRHLDADFATVTSHLTPDFAKDYQSVASSLKQTIVQYKGTSTAKVQGAAVAALHGTSKADVLVFLDQTVSSAQSKTPRIDRNRLQLRLERRDGTWLIADLQLK